MLVIGHQEQFVRHGCEGWQIPIFADRRSYGDEPLAGSKTLPRFLQQLQVMDSPGRIELFEIEHCARCMDRKQKCFEAIEEGLPQPRIRQERLGTRRIGLSVGIILNHGEEQGAIRGRIDDGSGVGVCTYVVPVTATSPKNTKTISSPSPR